jgi:hypothetical protein
VVSDGEPSDDDGNRDEEGDEDADDEPAALDPALIEAHSGILDAWEATVPEATRTAAMEYIIETGNVPEDAGLTEADVETLHAGYVAQTSVEVLDKIGITMEELAEHIDPADWPEFRREILSGNFEPLREHAKKGVALRHALGIPLKHKRWAKLQQAG